MEALEFLEDERESWRPYEALGELPDAALSSPSDAASPAGGWSALDLMIHMTAWREIRLGVARDLAVNERSEQQAALDAQFAAVGTDAINERIFREWRDLPVQEVRRRFATIPGELRGYLTAVPETRWIKNADVQRAFLADTIEHDDEHRAALAAILAAAGAA